MDLKLVSQWRASNLETCGEGTLDNGCNHMLSNVGHRLPVCGSILPVSASLILLFTR